MSAEDLLDGAGIGTTQQSSPQGGGHSSSPQHTAPAPLLHTFLKRRNLTDKYKPEQRLSHSASKEVWIVSNVVTKERFVAKLLSMTLMNEPERTFAMSELKCLSNCHHPNIIRFVEDYELEGSILLIMELALGGDLSLQLEARAQNRAHFRRHEAIVIFCQLFLAMDYIHSNRMLHRDIKSENIFVTSTGVLKIGDFGFTRQYEESISGTPGGTFCGTPHYLSPEICSHQAYGKKSDLWSVGVVLYEVIALRRPFVGHSIGEIMNQIVSGMVDPVTKYNVTCSEDIATLCHQLLSRDPDSRPSLVRIFRLPFIRYGLSDLRNAVLGNHQIPEMDRVAISKHIEKILQGTVCVAATAATESGELILLPAPTGGVKFQQIRYDAPDDDPNPCTVLYEAHADAIVKVTNGGEVGANVLVVTDKNGAVNTFKLNSNREVDVFVRHLSKP